MTPNRSTAVMARRIEPPDSLDYFPTQPWANRWKSSARGSRAAASFTWCCPCAVFRQVHATDVFRYNQDHGIYDFLDDHAPLPVHAVDWIFLNPPFNVGTRFIERAQRIARRGVAVIARTAFDEGGDRYDRLFRPIERQPGRSHSASGWSCSRAA
jgi:hypothetical protein